jgi:hypothetical protein
LVGRCNRIKFSWESLGWKAKKLYVGVIGDYQRRKSMYMCVEILYDIAGYLSILFASIGVNP